MPADADEGRLQMCRIVRAVHFCWMRDYQFTILRVTVPSFISQLTMKTPELGKVNVIVSLLGVIS